MSEGSDMPEESSETISAPVSAIGGAGVGDTVTLTVQSIEGDTATLAPAESDESDESAPAGSAISQASKMFNGGQ